MLQDRGATAVVTQTALCVYTYHVTLPYRVDKIAFILQAATNPVLNEYIIFLSFRSFVLAYYLF